MITIIGAGMAGLLAANMLRRHQPTILERQASLPNNHHAVLRFRSEEVSRQLHIPFKRVRVFKACDEPDPIKAAMLYSKKVTGRYEMRSLINLDPVERFIAPPNLIAQMASGIGIGIEYGATWRTGSDLLRGPYISTMPMEALMNLLDYSGKRPKFVFNPGWVVRAKVKDCEAYVTRYYSDPTFRQYRASITGDELIIEGVGEAPLQMQAEDMLLSVADHLGVFPEAVGLASIHEMRYSKIGRLDSVDRDRAKAFMFWATREHNIYSLGRFATWRAGLLMDDLVNDIICIERWLTNESPLYDIKKELGK